jgi:hypothetical protein
VDFAFRGRREGLTGSLKGTDRPMLHKQLKEQLHDRLGNKTPSK